MTISKPAPYSLESRKGVKMMTHEEFYNLLKTKHFDFFAGVPGSTFKQVISLLERDSTVTYIPAVSEDIAVGLAVGAYLGGKRPMVLMQNSGLGVSINALTSLALLYKIPILFLIGWRGYQGKDAPEHLIMGRCMLDLLQSMGMSYQVLETDTVYDSVERAIANMEDSHTPTALIIRKGVLA
jgi:phosphonopyruvate decarboxylase